MRKKLLLSHRRILHVDWFGIVTKCWGLAKNDERANDRSYCEDPQKKSIKNHCYETPVLIFRIKLVLSLYVMLNEHHIVQRFLKFEGILLPRSYVAQRLVQSGHYRRKSIIPTDTTKKSVMRRRCMQSITS